MYKITVLNLCLMAFSFVSSAQTIGEKYQLPEEAAQLRTDGVYHLPASLLPNGRDDLNAYLRFFPDGTFIIFHSRLTPDEKPQNFQINCNYQRIESATAPFNKDFTLKTNNGISRAKINYGDDFLLLEMDVRKDVIAMQLKAYNSKGKKIGKPSELIAPFHPIEWPVSRIMTGRR